MALPPGTRIGPYDVARATPDRAARFEREARLLASINHPNIATIEVPSLADLIAQGPIGVAERGMSSAHARGIVHRDLMPSNVPDPSHGARPAEPYDP